MFDDVPNVDTLISNLPSRLSDWVIKRTFSIVESLSLFLFWNESKIEIRLKVGREKKNCQSILEMRSHSPYINFIGFDVSNRISNKRHLLFAYTRQTHANPSQHGNRRKQRLQELRLHAMLLTPIQNRYAINFNMAYRRRLQCFRDGFESFRCIIQMNYPITDF